MKQHGIFIENEEGMRLLKECYKFICFIPNKSYKGGEYSTSYKLAHKLEQFLDKFKK